MKIIIDFKVYQKLESYIRNCNDEISGLGRCKFLEDGVIYIYDAFLLKQSVSAANTDIDDDAQAKLIYEETKKGTIKDLNLWWHSHADMEVFWSGTDEDTIDREKNGSLMVSVVMNKKKEIKARLDIYKPTRITIDIDDIEIDYRDDEVDKLCREDINNLVNKETNLWKKNNLQLKKKRGEETEDLFDSREFYRKEKSLKRKLL